MSTNSKVYSQVSGTRNLLVLENDWIRVETWPEIGAAVVGFIDKQSGLDVMFKNPNVVRPQAQLMTQPVKTNSDLYDVLDGSWFVSAPTGFFPVDYFGAPIGAHGEFRSLNWETTIEKDSGDILRVRVTGHSVRTPFVLERVWELAYDSRILSWEETLHNRSGRSRPCAWLHHPSFGGDLIKGAELKVRANTIVTHHFDRTQVQPGFRGRWPEVPLNGQEGVRNCSLVPEEGNGVDHSIQITDFEVGWGCLWNAKQRLGFAMRWDEQFFPWAWSWAHAGGIEDYPMWGQGHLITLQPSTSPVGVFDDLVGAGQVLEVPAKSSVKTRMLTGFTNDPDLAWDL